MRLLGLDFVVAGDRGPSLPLCVHDPLEFRRRRPSRDKTYRREALLDVGLRRMYRTSDAICSRSAIGMSFGPNRPRKPPNVNSGYPASFTVGISGAAGVRCSFVTARILILPACAAPSTEATGITAIWMRPSERSAIAFVGLL